MTSVLVVRDRDLFSEILERHGFRVENCPSIKTVPLVGPVSIGPDFDAVFITSRRAAELVGAANGFQGKLYVLGRSSFEVLKDRGFDLRYYETANNASELVAAIPVAELAGKRVLFIRGEESMRSIPEALAGRSEVVEIVAYRTEAVAIDPNLFERDFDWICFFSPSGARSFLRQGGGQALKRARIAAIGETTARFLRDKGFEPAFVATRPGAAEFAAQFIKGVET